MGSERVKQSPPSKRQSRSPSAQDTRDRPLKIGAAAKLVGVEAYVLRFWETQFSFIRPKQSRSRHRYYTLDDIETLKTVKRLLHTEGYTIAGARRFVREGGLVRARAQMTSPEQTAQQRATDRISIASPDSSPAPFGATSNCSTHNALREIREDLRELQKLLEGC